MICWQRTRVFSIIVTSHQAAVNIITTNKYIWLRKLSTWELDAAAIRIVQRIYVSRQH